MCHLIVKIRKGWISAFLLPMSLSYKFYIPWYINLPAFCLNSKVHHDMGEDIFPLVALISHRSNLFQGDGLGRDDNYSSTYKHSVPRLC